MLQLLSMCIFQEPKKLNIQLKRHKTISAFCKHEKISRATFYNKIRQYNLNIINPTPYVKSKSILSGLISQVFSH